MTQVEKNVYYRDWRRRHPEQVREAKRKCRAKNPAKYAAASRAWLARNPDKAAAQKARSMRNRRGALYGLTPAQYDHMLEQQGGRCVICGVPQTEMARAFGVDHNHQTSKIRALLCGLCNAGLGCFRDSVEMLERVARYLEKHQ